MPDRVVDGYGLTPPIAQRVKDRGAEILLKVLEDKVAFLQEQWRQAFGIDVTPAGLEWGAYLDRLNTDPFDIFRLGWGADYPHPNNFLTDLMVCGGGNNNMGYCNEEVDALLQEAAVAPTLEEHVAADLRPSIERRPRQGSGRRREGWRSWRPRRRRIRNTSARSGGR